MGNGYDNSFYPARRPGSVFVAVDHFSAEWVGLHAAKHGTRFEVLEPIRQGVRVHFGAFGQDTADGLMLRHDHGSQYMSQVFQDEVAFSGIESWPAFSEKLLTAAPRWTTIPPNDVLALTRLLIPHTL